MAAGKPQGPVYFRPGDTAKEADGLYQRATAHLARNDVAAALPLLHECLRRNPAHYASVRAIAAIGMKNGLEERAREILENYFMRFPGRTIRASRLGKAPALLSIRGFSGTRVIPWQAKDGTVGTRFRGGHFTTRFLIANPDWPEHRYTIARDNILRPGALPAFGLMLNTIADPDVEAATLATLHRYLDAHPATPLINHPGKVLQTTRDANWRRLRGTAGVLFPETHRVEFDGADADAVAQAAARHGLGDGAFILRSTGTHTARSTALIRSRAEIDAYVGTGDRHRKVADGRISGPHYLIRYVQRLWKGEYFRKLRLFRIDGAFYPVVCHIDRVWNVHGGNRKHIMRGDAALMNEEKRFLLDWRSYVGAANADRLERVAELAGLEFFGIDFTCDDDGILIYEMNPAMRHSFDHAAAFAYKLPYDLAITQAFTRMLETRLAR